MDNPAKTNPPVTSSLPSMGDDSTPPMPIVTTPTGGDMQPAVPRKKFGSGKIIAAIFGVLLLVGGAVAGVLLVQQQQEIRERAGGAAECNGSASAAACQGKFVGDIADGVCTCTASGLDEKGSTNCACVALSTTPPTPPTPAQSAIGSVCKEFPDRNVTGCARFECPNGCGSDGQCGTGDPGAVYTENCASLGGACGQIDWVSGTSFCDIKENTCATCGGGQPTPTPRLSVCGESCQADSDCSDSTFPGINVVCRSGQCVNQTCFDQGKTTEFGTICSCKEATGVCGEPCGADIGLCATGFTCTYRAQSQCKPGTRGVCVPPGTTNATTQRGPMSGVPLYQGTAFERRQCGSSTTDPQNNYIYHASFPNHAFTDAEVNQYICNPTTPSGQCLNILAYDTNWTQITDLATLKAGDVVRFVAKGSTTQGSFDKARFTINSTLRPERTQVRPGTTNEFYDEYTIPTGATSLTIKAELHHTTLGWF